MATIVDAILTKSFCIFEFHVFVDLKIITTEVSFEVRPADDKTSLVTITHLGSMHIY